MGTWKLSQMPDEPEKEFQSEYSFDDLDNRLQAGFEAGLIDDAYCMMILTLIEKIAELEKEIYFIKNPV